MVLHYLLDRLDDHDGVVHDDTDRQHHREQRDGVGRIADRIQHDERADQADRHGDCGDQRRPQTAQEQVDDKHDQNERLDQRLLDLMDRGSDKCCRVISNLPGEIVREVLRRILHHLLDAAECAERVGTWRLIDGNQRRGRAVQAGRAVEVRRPQFHSGNIPQMQHGAVRIGPDHDLLEFRGRCQPALRLNVELQLLVVGNRAGADPSDRGLHVL
jgi:hypothetical protein